MAVQRYMSSPDFVSLLIADAADAHRSLTIPPRSNGWDVSLAAFTRRAQCVPLKRDRSLILRVLAQNRGIGYLRIDSFPTILSKCGMASSTRHWMVCGVVTRER